MDLRLPSLRRTILVAALIPTAVIALLWALLAWEVRLLSAYNRDVVHSYDVIANTWRTNKLLVDGETGLRAYLLARDRAFLEPYASAGAELPQALDDLDRQLSDDPSELTCVRELRKRYQAWRRSAEAAIASPPPLAPVLPPAAREEMVLRKADMDAMRQAMRTIHSEEGRRLEQRRERAETTARALFVSGTLVALLLSGAAGFGLRVLLRSVDSAYAASYQAQVESAQRAEQANRMKDDFLATLSHELRTPLNAIVGWAHILLTAGGDEATTRKGAATIYRNALAQNQLVSDLLDVSRIITGKLALKVSSIELVPVVEKAIETMSAAAQAKGIHLDVVLDPTAGLVSGDPDRLQQVVWNLLSNAVKFTPRGGRLQVRLERAGSHTEIVVADTGPGIPEDVLPRVFERFWQGDSSTSRAHGGLGLGLAIVRHLVELHGGTVAVANRQGTSGAVFTVRLPLRALAAAAATPWAREPPSAHPDLAFDRPPSLDGVHVIAVDDEPDARALVQEVLTRCGATVALAASAGDALAMVRHEPPDVVVADVGMPGEDGYTFIKKMRALPADQGGRTPALALTAFAGSEDRLRALSAGFAMHLPKPVDPVALAWAVRTLAEMRHVETA